MGGVTRGGANYRGHASAVNWFVVFFSRMTVNRNRTCSNHLIYLREDMICCRHLFLMNFTTFVLFHALNHLWFRIRMDRKITFLIVFTMKWLCRLWKGTEWTQISYRRTWTSCLLSTKAWNSTQKIRSSFQLKNFLIPKIKDEGLHCLGNDRMVWDCFCHNDRNII